jgi:ribonuclease Z
MKSLRVLILSSLAFMTLASVAWATDMRVTLLGTGTPILNINRFGMSTLVEAGGLKLLFDAGRGAAMRLHQAKVPLREITAIFVTHLHSDHIAGIPDVYATAPLIPPGAGRRVPLEIWGPQGIADVARGVELMFTANNRIRLTEKELVPEVTKIATHDVPPDGGAVFQKDGVVVTAFLVDHGHAKPAYGYRIDHDGHAVVLSGDTIYTPNLIQRAKGVDLLVHCVAIGSRRLEEAAPELAQRRYSHLANPEMVGRILNEVSPKQAVLSHISLMSRADIPRPGNAELQSRIGALYKGPFIIGEDLMSFLITRSGVTAEPYSATRRQQEPE